MFRYATAHTALISIAALRRLFPQRVISVFGDVPWASRSPDLTAPDFFFCGVIWKTCTVLALQTYMHSKKIHGKKSPNFQKKHFQALMRTFITRVYLCIEEGGGHLTDILLKKWNYVKKVNCDVLKLVSITFSKMLFLFIISSLFLPHPVCIYIAMP